ncbi:MAG TPA: respiratory nitrate reductase subunit gamma [Thermoanaerobaculia bacterium]
MGDELLFAIFPYTAAALLVLGTATRVGLRLRGDREAPAGEPAFRSLYAGSRAWRYGLLVLLAGHLFAFALPPALIWWDLAPARLVVLEAAGFLAGLAALVGLVGLVRRRFAAVGTLGLGAALADGLLLTFAAVAIVSGLIMALAVRWGSSWYAVTIVPYLRSLLTLRPDVTWVAATPPVVRLHVLSGVALLAVLPFTALVDAVALPAAKSLARTLAESGNERTESRDEVALS